MRLFLGRFLGFSMLAACALVAKLPDARAQIYPDRPITIVVPVSYTHLTLPTTERV